MGIFTKDPNDAECYGIKFKWSPLHRTPEQLSPMLRTYDKLSTTALDRLDELVPAPADEPTEKKVQKDYFKLLSQYAKEDETVRELWEEVNATPEWVDWAQIERGQKVFWRYGGAAVTSLMFLSLLGGMAGGRIVETLDRTGGFNAEVVRRRLLETTQHTLGVHKDLKSIQPGGDGWESSIRVRLLHSNVRRRIINLAKQKPEYYDLQNFGIPINDLDCIGTINTFSSAVVWLGFPRQGIFLSRRETLDFLALWRYIAYIMGTPHDWLQTPEGAKAMMESLLVSEIKPSKKSGTLANNIITGFEGTAPTFASRGFLNAQTYWLNGSELSKELNIEKPTLYYTSLVFAQCWLFMVIGYMNRTIPFLDEQGVKFMRNTFYEVLIEKKELGALGYKAMFSFKWIPSLMNPTTPLGEPDKARRNAGGLSENGLERVALFTLILMLSSVGYFGYAGVKYANNSGLTSSLLKYFKFVLSSAPKLIGA